MADAAGTPCGGEAPERYYHRERRSPIRHLPGALQFSITKKSLAIRFLRLLMALDDCCRMSTIVARA